jgi:hypothetical protein
VLSLCFFLPCVEATDAIPEDGAALDSEHRTSDPPNES